MITLNLSAPERPPDSRPQEGENNLWHQYRDSDRCIVFVHGLGDDSRGCWYSDSAGSYWPDRLAASHGLSDYSIYLGGYYTHKLKSKDYGVADCAAELFKGLAMPGRQRPVIEHKAILFVCHSLGGIVTRYMLESKRDRFQDQAIGLFLFASPSTGSGWADVVGRIANYLDWNPSDVLKLLATNSPLLADLDGRFKDLIHKKKGGIPRLLGREACETEGLKKGFPVVVNCDSAGRYFASVEKLAGTNHSTCVKPDSDRHPAHKTLLSWIVEFEEEFKAVLPERKPASLVCRRLQLNVRVVNEDGDAEHEIAYSGISGVQNGQYRLPGTKQGISGHPSDPSLDKVGSTASVEIDSDATGNLLKFTNPPNVDQQMNAVYRLHTFSAFSMDARERALRRGEQPDVDYLQKTLDQENIQDLVIHLQVHPSMHLNGLPYIEVRMLGNGELDPKETSRAARMLDYSPLLATSTLFVRDPLRERRYRLCWRLGNPSVAATSPTDKELDVQQDLVETLLWLRGCHEIPNPGSTEQEAIHAVNACLSQCAGLVASALGQDAAARLTADGIDVTLMAVDDTDESRLPALRLVRRGMTEGGWDLPLPVGDGNAGRAAKKLQIRFYDRERAAEQPFQHVYKPIPGGKPHQWLMSIPLFSSKTLVYGVVNVATFQKRNVRQLRHLEEQAKSAELAEGVQKNVWDALHLLRSKYGEKIREHANKSQAGKD